MKWKSSEPVQRLIEKKDAKVYYTDFTLERNDGFIEQSPYMQIYVDEEPLGSLDFVITFDKKRNILSTARGPYKEDIQKFQKLVGLEKQASE
ncbi:MAG: hypothetical protein Q8N88_03940 [Nanoarchaeota archaeon]|nr:hypothetical protein [Nanoarchaeota archaeon]